MEAQKTTFSSSALLPVITAEKNNNGAEFTVVSKATGKDYTFKIKRTEFNGRYYTHIYVETQYLEFSYVGSYFNGTLKRKGKKVDTPTANVMAWILIRVEKQMFDVLDEQIEFLHLGCCLRCGRTLTDETSIKIGLGPICRG